MNIRGFVDDFGRRIEVRHWVAWQLTKLAYRLHHCDNDTRLRVFAPDGALIVELGISGDCWGSGLWSSHFPGHDAGYRVTDTGGLMFDKPDTSEHYRVERDPVYLIDTPYCGCCWKDWPCPDAQEAT